MLCNLIFHFIFRLPVLIIPNKKRQPDGPGQPHQIWLKCKQEGNIESQPPEKPIIVHRHPDQNPPGNKRGHRQCHRKRVTNIPCAIIKTYFYFHALATNRAVIIHFHKIFQPVCLLNPEHISRSAPGAFKMKEAP